MRKSVWRRVAMGLLVVLVLIQGVPYGRDHENPPTTGTPDWNSARTRELAARACFDCHSHETHWPWYASIAPLSWRIQHHVEEGREHLNFSAFDQPQKDADEAAEMVEKGAMPLSDFLLMHPEARLTEAEKLELVEGLAATFGRKHDKGSGGAGTDDDDDSDSDDAD